MKTKLTALLVMICLLLAGCSASNPVQEDLLNYINEELPTIADLEATVLDTYDSVSGDNYTDDQTMYNALNDTVVPASSDLIDAAEAIEPQTEEVRELHELYIEAINTQHAAFNIVVIAIEEQNADKIVSANEKLTEARKIMRDYNAKLDELAQENGVEITYDDSGE